ncbi:TIGR00366 family protein [Halomicroarcula sp. F13]|uniref:TIGR00366 family protein n=1 Tax=Haloarcula rubra TaxID=2487747 RepID=A0AAW4PW85_9EURY|nr:TIGR00366 family protein [Halomicroarcula rubra]MBX0325973.1 TIGR00366 family protein [Halomicroarcula rubra]
MSFIDPVRRLGEWFSDWSLRYIPDPYVIGILLTLLTVASALVSGSAPKETMDAWYTGVWTLLPFMATLSVMLMAGDAIAKSPSVTHALERIASIPNSPFVAVWFTAFVAMVTALVSWAIGLIVGAIMARRVAYECRQKGIKVHYPLLAAAGYTSLMIFHSGLSSSAALIMTDPSLIPASFPASVQNGIPLSETLGSTANLVSAGLLLTVIPVVMAAMHPKDEIRELPGEIRSEIKENLESEPPTETQPEDTAFPSRPTLTFADRLNNSQLLGLVIAIFPLYYVINTWFLVSDPSRFIFQPGGLSKLTLNSINALFLFFAIVLWKRPINIVNQMKDSVKNISGIIFMFPFYAGIAGLLTNTGLAQQFTEVLATVATKETWPVIGILISAIVNVFIPSGGGQWVAQGPILIETSQQFGYEPWVAVVIEILGDPLTNMIQPFWAIPLLAIADLRARDIIGYTAVAMVVGLLLVSATVTVFIGLA